IESSTGRPCQVMVSSPAALRTVLLSPGDSPRYAANPVGSGHSPPASCSAVTSTRSHHRPSGWRKQRLVCETSFSGWYGLAGCSPAPPFLSTGTAGANAWNCDGTGSGGTNPGGRLVGGGLAGGGLLGCTGAKADGGSGSEA